MDINPVTQPAAIQAGAGSGAASGTAAISSDFETFIRMLTVQMQNQDPLNPIESSDFAVQLATFSTVEQQVRTNDLLTSLGAQMGAQNLAQLSGWVGMEARATMPVVFDGAPVTLTAEGASLADAAQLVVRNDRGEVVQRQEIAPARQEVQWAGVGAGGDPLPPGTYRIEVESLSQGEVIATQPVEVHGRIVEARNQGGQAVLIMEGGQEVPSQDILALSSASQG